MRDRKPHMTRMRVSVFRERISIILHPPEEEVEEEQEEEEEEEEGRGQPEVENATNDPNIEYSNEFHERMNDSNDLLPIGWLSG